MNPKLIIGGIVVVTIIVVGVLIWALTSTSSEPAPAPSSSGAGAGASSPPPPLPPTPLSFALPDKLGGKHSLSCPSGKKMEVNSARWGTASGCGADVLPQFKALCDGNETCEIPGDFRSKATDPCPYQAKTINGAYICL